MKTDGELRCESLRLHFDGVCALSGVTLAFPAGKVTAIIGPNGAGKTTLLHVLTGFLRPDGGRTYLGRREISSLPPFRIAQLGVGRTFQDLRLILGISVLDNLLLAFPRQQGEGLLSALTPTSFRREERLNRQTALLLLQQLGLEGFSGQAAGTLSYGQQKLLSLACCLATGASVLLLDEPVAGVDPEMSAKILKILTDCRADGKTVVFVEHDITAVRQVADWLVVMDEGKVIAEGEPREVLRLPEIMEAYLA